MYIDRAATSNVSPKVRLDHLMAIWQWQAAGSDALSFPFDSVCQARSQRDQGYVPPC